MSHQKLWKEPIEGEELEIQQGLNHNDTCETVRVWVSGMNWCDPRATYHAEKSPPSKSAPYVPASSSCTAAISSGFGRPVKQEKERR